MNYIHFKMSINTQMGTRQDIQCKQKWHILEEISLAYGTIPIYFTFQKNAVYLSKKACGYSQTV